MDILKIIGKTKKKPSNLGGNKHNTVSRSLLGMRSGVVPFWF